MSTMLSIIVLICLVSVPLTAGCSCLDTTLHELVCRADYLVRVKVLSETRGADEFADMFYTVEVLNDYMNSDRFTDTQTVDIWTPGFDGMCKAPLRVGSIYYLGGTIHGNKIWIRWCDFWKAESSLKPCQQKLISTRAFDCTCKDPSCYQDC